MFDTLDTIDWPRLETAYSTAEAIPAALCALASPDEEIRAVAWETLLSELEHQGTVYQASAFAAPFLLEWLSKLQGEEKCELVFLLSTLARGNSFKRQHLNLTDKQRKEDQVFQQEMAEEIGWVELTHQAVRKGMELYLSFLDNPNLQLRMATTYLLASFQEDQARLAPRLQTYLVQETDERMIACLLLSLGQLLPAIADSSVLLMREAIPEEVVLVFFTFLTCKRQEESEPSATVKLSHLLSNQPVRTMSPASVNSGESESSHLP